MNSITFTLLSDGSSDRALMPIIEWVLKKECPDLSVKKEWADLRKLAQPPQQLWEKINKAIEYYPCDILFIHRDAESEPLQTRLEEIAAAIKKAKNEMGNFNKETIPVIPVRMTEAWLLIDEKAIRKAAGNPNGQTRVDLPQIRELEQLSDPKKILHDILQSASGLKGRHLKTFNISQACYLISSFSTDFSQLLSLVAFKRLVDEVKILPLIVRLKKP